MLNLLTKTMPWMVASLLVATSGFGQDNRGYSRSQQKGCDVKCEKVCPTVCPVQLIPAYNHPARIDTRCPWDVNVVASFIYWQPTQENMELGIANTTAAGSLTTIGAQGDVVEMNFKFKPGFQVGLGFSSEHDDWDFQSLYTWLHFTESTQSNGPAASGSGILPMVGMPDSADARNVYNTANQSWRLKMDLLDLNMGRWSYVGTKLTCRPYFGARVAWLRQRRIATYVNDSSNGIAGTDGTLNSTDKTVSWGIGPEAGFNSNWMVGEGFRLYGNGMFDVIYTRYNKLSHAETNTASSSTYAPSVNGKVTSTMRTHFSLEMGFGWGTYLDCNNWYLDMMAGYTFQAFNDQNMFRHFNDATMPANSQSPNGNLYVQGLTATVRLDF